MRKVPALLQLPLGDLRQKLVERDQQLAAAINELVGLFDVSGDTLTIRLRFGSSMLTTTLALQTAIETRHGELTFTGYAPLVS